MGKPVILANSSLEKTIDKILDQTEQDVLSNLDGALSDSHQTLDNSVTKLEDEYDKIVADGRKEADKLEKQIVGSSDIEARNKQLLAVEDAVSRVFTKAVEEISNSDVAILNISLQDSLLVVAVTKADDIMIGSMIGYIRWMAWPHYYYKVGILLKS